MSSAISQLSCFSSINRRLLQLHTRSIPCLSLRPKVLVVASRDGPGAEISSSETKTTLNYSSDTLKSQNEMSTKSYTTTEAYAAGKSISEPVQEQHVVTQQKRAAKIHDFCFGIPFGGIIMSGGLVGFIFSRNPATSGTTLLLGGALLALSTLSLKVWRQGISSLPLIIGQAVLSTVLLWRNFQTYSLTKKIFPTGLYAFISAAMLCFYLYVVVSGGNPPPKKLKTSSAAVLS